MITKLEIKGFKSLVDVSIELGAVNVFIGANGSGKSNLLEAVGFLSAIVSGSLEAESLRCRGVRTGQPSAFGSCIGERERFRSSLAMTGEQISYTVEFEPDPLHSTRWRITDERGSFEESGSFVRTNGHFTVVGFGGEPTIDLEIQPHFRNWSRATYAYTISSMRKLKYKSTLFVPDHEGPERLSIEEPTVFDLISPFAIFTPSTPQLRGSRTDIQREPLGLGGSGLGQAIGDMLKLDPEKLGPFDLEDVYELIDWADSLTIDERSDPSTRLRIGDRFMGNGHKTVSLLEASEGALYVLFLLALVGHEDTPKIFGVDNFDQALHPRLARELTVRICDQILEDGNRQMLATTHNPLVLDGLDLLDDRIRLFTVDRDQTGATQVKRVQVTEELMALADQGMSLSRLWVSGRFGGVPKSL